MNFIEERTPKGMILKILFDTWKFLAFNSKGKPIYADEEGHSLLHHVPLIVFIGKNFSIVREYDKEYILLKVRKDAIIVPYKDLTDYIIKYIFIQTDKEMDLIPVRFIQVDKIQTMVKDVDIATRPDYVIVDETVSANDIIILKNRYKVEEVIHAEQANNHHLVLVSKQSHKEKSANLNMLSTNPVYLAGIHLRSFDLSKLNQLLLDFDLTALDVDYILFYLNEYISQAESDPAIQKHEYTLLELRSAFEFYLYLLQRSDEDIRKMINSHDSVKKLAPYKTLVSKVKSIFPGREEQEQYSEYERLLVERQEQIQPKTPATS